MRKTFIACVVIVLMACCSYAQAGAEYYVENSSPLQVSIVPPFAFPPDLNTVRGARVSVIGSLLNIYGLDAGAVNMAMNEMLGIQAAGLWNRTGLTKGIQLSFGGNFSETTYGYQAAALINRSKNLIGKQLALVNIAEDVWGTQVAPFANVAYYVYGFQGIAAYNGCAALRGVQVGAINMTQLMTGLQMGIFYNFAAQMDNAGLQLSPINITGYSSGCQFGLINISRTRVMPIFNWPDN